jgi:hypothetical protein
MKSMRGWTASPKPSTAGLSDVWRTDAATPGNAVSPSLLPLHGCGSQAGGDQAPGGRLLLVEAVAQTTHRSGASICDGTTHARTAEMARKWEATLVRAINREKSPTS